jgi:hypothetical protein
MRIQKRFYTNKIILCWLLEYYCGKFEVLLKLPKVPKVPKRGTNQAEKDLLRLMTPTAFKSNKKGSSLMPDPYYV